VIHAPDWFLDALPRMFLDGELWSQELEHRQEISSIIKKLIPNDQDWAKIIYMVFDSPNLSIFSDGTLNTTNFKKTISRDACHEFLEKVYPLEWMSTTSSQYRSIYHSLGERLASCRVASRVQQYELDFNTAIAIRQIEYRLNIVTETGGEGLIVRNPDAVWKPERSHNMLKVKELDDAEGVVIGYVTGKLTDLGSKHLGRIGALIIDFDGHRMELAGLNDEERVLIDKQTQAAALKAGEDIVWAEILGKDFAYDWSQNHPGQECPKHFDSILIPKGRRITFKYRGLSKDGIPQEARYWRQREEV
jgi:ATP-dependent DNA ligase